MPTPEQTAEHVQLEADIEAALPGETEEARTKRVQRLREAARHKAGTAALVTATGARTVGRTAALAIIDYPAVGVKAVGRGLRRVGRKARNSHHLRMTVHQANKTQAKRERLERKQQEAVKTAIEAQQQAAELANKLG